MQHPIQQSSERGKQAHAFRRVAASFNQITAANAGWRTQFCFRGSRHPSGVAEFYRSA